MGEVRCNTMRSLLLGLVLTLAICLATSEDKVPTEDWNEVAEPAAAEFAAKSQFEDDNSEELAEASDEDASEALVEADAEATVGLWRRRRRRRVPVPAPQYMKSGPGNPYCGKTSAARRRRYKNNHNGAGCSFPFTYGGKIYNSCTKDGCGWLCGNKAWCYNKNGGGAWSFCTDQCLKYDWKAAKEKASKQEKSGKEKQSKAQEKASKQEKAAKKAAEQAHKKEKSGKEKQSKAQEKAGKQEKAAK